MQIISPEPPRKLIQEGDVKDENEDVVYEYFLKVSGVDKEVDWRELKEVLDHTIKSELQSEDYNTSSTLDITKTNFEGVNAAAPNSEPSQQTQTGENENFLTNLLGLICGTFCKDSALADLVPQPKQNSTLMASFSEYHLKGFSKDICRSMMAMLDTDRSGKLGFEEFKILWRMLEKWKDVWSRHDVDRSGSLSGFELRAALNKAGYRLNNRILNVMMHRYGNRNGEITFDDFLMCAIKFKTMLDVFLAKDESQTNSATFSKEEWLEVTLSS